MKLPDRDTRDWQDLLEAMRDVPREARRSIEQWLDSERRFHARDLDGARSLSVEAANWQLGVHFAYTSGIMVFDKIERYAETQIAKATRRSKESS